MRPKLLPTLIFATAVAAVLFIPRTTHSLDSNKPATLPAADAASALDKAEDLLRTGSWSEGRTEVARALRIVLGSPLEGDGGRPILGRALALRAIAHAGLDEILEATFDAHAVESFGFDPSTLGLASFGKAGEIFERAKISLASTSEIRRVGGEVSRPQILSKVNPVYSEGTRRENIQGTTILEAVIDKSGRITQGRVLKSIHPQLDFAGLEAVRQWIFEPSKFEGQPVSVYYVLTISFQVETESEGAAAQDGR